MAPRLLEWTVASSADEMHADLEADLGKVGRPCGGVWVSVYHDGDWWEWEVMNAWIYDEADIIAGGRAESREKAQEAVETWVATSLAVAAVTGASGAS